MLDETLHKMLTALNEHEGAVRSLALEDAAHAHSAGMEALQWLEWVSDRADEHGFTGADRALFASTFVDELVSLVAMEVGR